MVVVVVVVVVSGVNETVVFWKSCVSLTRNDALVRDVVFGLSKTVCFLIGVGAGVGWGGGSNLDMLFLDRAIVWDWWHM